MLNEQINVNIVQKDNLLEVHKRNLATINPLVNKETSVRLVGAGTLGSHIAYALVKSHFGKIVVNEIDTVEAHNYASQFFSVENIGKSKFDALAALLHTIDSDVELLPAGDAFTTTTESLREDIIILATDNLPTRLYILDLAFQRALRYGKLFLPLVNTFMKGAYQFGVQVINAADYYQAYALTFQWIKEEHHRLIYKFSQAMRLSRLLNKKLTRGGPEDIHNALKEIVVDLRDVKMCGVESSLVPALITAGHVHRIVNLINKRWHERKEGIINVKEANELLSDIPLEIQFKYDDFVSPSLSVFSIPR